MKIVQDKKKLETILQEEKSKMRATRYKINNMSKNNKKKFINTTSSYLWVIRESEGRLHSTYKPPSKNVKFSNNKNWKSNFSGFINATPLVLLSNNGRYMGHVWVNGSKSPNRSTGHFQQIQKSVNMNNFLTRFVKNKPPSLPRTRVAPVLLNATEKHLKALGYNAMSTEFPLGQMMTYFNSQPNVWKTRGLVYTKKI
jgi:hypothetical protein